uniref:SXP/RAL-2 family protein Ani s 5-like cation-binding domain-containing protein n=1 Tax=Graphocephala atropunctata TaxID=36148 RepID=A0A1B6KVJ7_9HEMI
MWPNIVVLGLVLVYGASTTLAAPQIEKRPEGKNGDTKPRSFGNSQSPEETEKRITELVKIIAQVVSEDITIASQTFSEKGNLFSEAEAADFFETVAVTTLQRLESYIRELNALTNNNQQRAQEISERVATEAANTGFKDLFNEQATFEPVVMKEGVLGITQQVKEFIKLALTSPEE